MNSIDPVFLARLTEGLSDEQRAQFQSAADILERSQAATQEYKDFGISNGDSELKRAAMIEFLQDEENSDDVCETVR